MTSHSQSSKKMTILRIIKWCWSTLRSLWEIQVAVWVLKIIRSFSNFLVRLSPQKKWMKAELDWDFQCVNSLSKSSRVKFRCKQNLTTEQSSFSQFKQERHWVICKYLHNQAYKKLRKIQTISLNSKAKSSF